MLGDWSIWGSIIAFGIIVMFARSSQKTQYPFSKKRRYVHVRSIKF